MAMSKINRERAGRAKYDLCCGRVMAAQEALGRCFTDAELKEVWKDARAWVRKYSGPDGFLKPDAPDIATDGMEKWRKRGKAKK